MTVPEFEAGAMRRGERAPRLVPPMPPALLAAASIALASLALTMGSPAAAGSDPTKIVVFDFELDDKSASGGVLSQDPVDIENLRTSTEEARRALSASGRYAVVGVGGTAGEMASAGGALHCNGCEAGLAGKLGAEQSMVGVFTRISRAEYTLQILVRDAASGKVVSNSFSGLRMGANYAWPRGVKRLMDKVLSGPGAP